MSVNIIFLLFLFNSIKLLHWRFYILVDSNFDVSLLKLNKMYTVPGTQITA